MSTEHLLLGLLHEPDSTACKVLNLLGAGLDQVREQVEKQLPRGDARKVNDMTLTPRAKRVIDCAYDEARNLDDKYIGTEHLLLGLIREGDGVAGRVLAAKPFNVTLAIARRMVHKAREEPVAMADFQLAPSTEVVLLPKKGWVAICQEAVGDPDTIYVITIYPTKTIETKNGSRRVIDRKLAVVDQVSSDNCAGVMKLGQYLREQSGGQIRGFPQMLRLSSNDRAVFGRRYKLEE